MPRKTCQKCRADISHRAAAAKYCVPCAKAVDAVARVDRRWLRRRKQGGTKLCADCGVDITLVRRALKYCRDCGQARRVQIHNARYQGAVPSKEELFHRQGGICGLTGMTMIYHSPAECHVDHIIPVSRGGRHVPENVWLVHAAANQAKMALTPSEFFACDRYAETCSQVADDVMRRAAEKE